MIRPHDSGADRPRAVQELLDRLGLVVRRPIGAEAGQRYFCSVVSPARRVRGRQYFIKVALTSQSATLLQREIQVSLAVDKLGMPVPQLITHNADDGRASLRFALYECVPAGIDNGWVEADHRELKPHQAPAIAETICRLRSIDAAVLAAVAPLAQTFFVSFQNWFASIAETLLSPTPPGLRSPWPTLAEALRDPAGKPLTDLILSFAASLEPIFTRTGCEFVVHGDCSPANTCWRTNGVAVLVDWEWAGVAPAPSSLPTRARDVANYVTRAWQNAEFSQALLREYLRRSHNHPDEVLALRAALIDRALDKLSPLSAYYEEHWFGTKGPSRFRAISALLYAALTGRIADSRT